MKNPLVSIIIPVYNVEPYLKECLDSIVNQTYSLLEIILVDDGSTDQSGVICDEYAEKDDRIRVIHQHNQGLSMARNAGMEIMTGEWVMFVDSDDWIDVRTISICMEEIQKEVSIDILEFACRDVFTHNEVDRIYLNTVLYSNVEALRKMVCENSVTGTVWAKLFNTEHIRHLRFIRGRKHEDTPFVFEALFCTSQYKYISEVLYYYRREREGQITGQFSEQKLDMLYNIEHLKEKYRNDKTALLYLNTLYIFWVKSYFFEGLDQSASVKFLHPHIRKAKSFDFYSTSKKEYLKWKFFLYMPYLYVALVSKILPRIRKLFTYGCS